MSLGDEALDGLMSLGDGARRRDSPGATPPTSLPPSPPEALPTTSTASIAPQRPHRGPLFDRIQQMKDETTGARLLADLVGAITHSNADASTQPPTSPYLQQGKTSDDDLFERLADEHPWFEQPPPDDSDDGATGAPGLLNESPEELSGSETRMRTQT